MQNFFKGRCTLSATKNPGTHMHATVDGAGKLTQWRGLCHCTQGPNTILTYSPNLEEVHLTHDDLLKTNISQLKQTLQHTLRAVEAAVIYSETQKGTIKAGLDGEVQRLC